MKHYFWNKIERGEGGCWLWQGSLDKDGYGYHKERGKNRRAHRYSYELLVGPIGKGLNLDHLCRVRHCVNPAHLEPVTPKENTRRGLNVALKTHCSNGLHEWIPENIMVMSGGLQTCHPCNKIYHAAYQRRARANWSPEQKAKKAAYMKKYHQRLSQEKRDENNARARQRYADKKLAESEGAK